MSMTGSSGLTIRRVFSLGREKFLELLLHLLYTTHTNKEPKVCSREFLQTKLVLESPPLLRNLNNLFLFVSLQGNRYVSVSFLSQASARTKSLFLSIVKISQLPFQPPSRKSLDQFQNATPNL